MSHNPDKDELTILRVPPHLSERIQAELAPDGEGLEIGSMSFDCINGNQFKFTYDSEEYHATLVNLPTLVETQKTIDNITFYQNGNIGQMLIVHDVKFDQPRPVEAASEPQEYHSGISPPMNYCVSRRFNSLNQAKFDTREVEKVDLELYELAREYAKRDEKEKLKPFVYEELIMADPIMDYFDDTTIIDEGTDNFKTNTRAVIEGAYQRYLVDKKKRDEAAASNPDQATRTEDQAPEGASGTVQQQHDDTDYLASLLHQKVSEATAKKPTPITVPDPDTVDNTVPLNVPLSSPMAQSASAAPSSSPTSIPTSSPSEKSASNTLPSQSPSGSFPRPSPSPSPTSTVGSVGNLESQSVSAQLDGPSPVVLELQSQLSSVQARIEQKATEESAEETKLAAILNPQLKMIFQKKKDAISAEKAVLEKQKNDILEKLKQHNTST